MLNNTWKKILLIDEEKTILIVLQSFDWIIYSLYVVTTLKLAKKTSANKP